MGKIDLIALDLDGTFLDPAGEISPASLEAVQAARATGVKVVLSTGRSGWEAAHFSKLAGCDSLAVCLGAQPCATPAPADTCAVGICRRRPGGVPWSYAWAGTSS